MTENAVIYEKEGDIGKITINKPDQNNSLDLNTLKELISACGANEELDKYIINK